MANRFRGDIRLYKITLLLYIMVSLSSNIMTIGHIIYRIAALQLGSTSLPSQKSVTSERASESRSPPKVSRILDSQLFHLKIYQHQFLTNVIPNHPKNNHYKSIKQDISIMLTNDFNRRNNLMLEMDIMLSKLYLSFICFIIQSNGMNKTC